VLLLLPNTLFDWLLDPNALPDWLLDPNALFDWLFARSPKPPLLWLLLANDPNPLEVFPPNPELCPKPELPPKVAPPPKVAALPNVGAFWFAAEPKVEPLLAAEPNVEP